MKNQNRFLILLVCVLAFLVTLYACNGTDRSAKNNSPSTLYSGLYSFGPKITSFTICEDTHEYWVIDSAGLETAYTNLGFEKPYTPAYVEIEGYIAKSDFELANAADYDSVLVVTKVLKITKSIPEGPCWQ